jgi:hypothetical protein
LSSRHREASAGCGVLYPRARVRRARSSRNAHVRLGLTGSSRPRRRRQSQSGWEPARRGPLGERPGARSGQGPSAPVRQTCFPASELKIDATRVPRQIRGPRQRRRDLGGSLRRRGERRVVYGGGSLGRCEISKRLHGEAGHGGAGGRRGLTGRTGRARERRGAFGGRAVRTLVPRRGERGARTIRSPGALVHGHARPIGRPRAVPCTMGAGVYAAAKHASADHGQHQGAEQEPQARRGSQEQQCPHTAQDNPSHFPQRGGPCRSVDTALLSINSIRTPSGLGLPRSLPAQ